MDRPLRIAQVAPPLERVPPEGYGGTERVMYELIVELVRRGHDVTTFASGDSDVPGHHVPTVPVALRPADFKDDPMAYFLTTMQAVLDSADDFDLIHSRLEWSSLILARATRVPVVATFHGRLDLPWSRELARRRRRRSPTHQASPHPTSTDGRPQRPVARQRALRPPPIGRAVLRRPRRAGEGRRRGDRDRRDRRAAAADRGQGRPDRRGARVPRRGLRPRAQGRRVVGRVPRRGLGPGARRAVRGSYAARCARVWPELFGQRSRRSPVARRSSPGAWRPARDHPRRGRRRFGDTRPSQWYFVPEGIARSAGDPEVGHRTVLGDPDGRRVRGALSSRPGRPVERRQPPARRPEEARPGAAAQGRLAAADLATIGR